MYRNSLVSRICLAAFAVGCVLSFLSALAMSADDQRLAIFNGHLLLEWDSEKGALSLSDGRELERSDLQPRLYASDLTIGGYSTRGVEWSDGASVANAVAAQVTPACAKKTTWKFGDQAAEAIAVTMSDGSVVNFALVGDLPFVLVQKIFAGPKDSDAAPTLVVRDNLVRMSLAAPAKAEKCKALGTAGLTAVDSHSGSYAFLAIAEPESRSGIVTGFVTGNRGSGVVFSGVDEAGQVTIDAKIDYGRLPLPAGESVESEIFAIGYFDDARLGLEAYADLIADYYDIKLDTPPCGYCTWYSSPNGGASDQVHLAELTDYAAEMIAPYGFDFVQIDDLWQDGKRRNGPAKLFFQVRPDGPYPDGMKKPADHITNKGMTPGIWFMPFAADRDDPFFIEHTDWLAKLPDGTPYWARWGGTTIDMTNPDAQAYVRSIVRRIAKDWGYRYFKMDGLWVGSGTELLYVNNAYKPDDIGRCVFKDPMKTNVEAYRDGLKLVREEAGPDVYFLGCNISQNMRTLTGSYGLVDAMRIGPDNGAGFGSLKRGPWHGTNRYFYHGRVWHNDPDPIYMRASMPLNHAQLICSWVAVTGQLNAFSEWLPGLPPERLDVLRRTMPNHGLRPRPVDLFKEDIARVWLLTDDSGPVRRDVVGLFNWNENESASFDLPLDRIGLPAKEYVGFDYWGNTFIPPQKDSLTVDVHGGSCRVLSLRPTADHPIVVGTSRHITSGIIDLKSEAWNTDTLTLKGTSEIIANDPYEIRIIVPIGASYKAIVATLNEKTMAAGAKVSIKQTGPRIRVTIDSPVSETIDWSIRFERAKIAVAKLSAPTDLTPDVQYGMISLDFSPVEGAIGYEIARSDGKTFRTVTPRLVDTTAPKGSELTYTVRAIGWSPSADLSPAAKITVTTPAAIVVPDVPPAPHVDIADLTPIKLSTGWGNYTKNRSIAGNPLTIAGKRYEKGVGIHAPSTVVYTVPEGMSRFVATIGLDDEEKSDDRRSVIAVISADAKEMGEPPVVLARSPILSNSTVDTWHFDVKLDDRTKEIRLTVEDAGDGIACDHADWVNTGFLKD